MGHGLRLVSFRVVAIVSALAGCADSASPLATTLEPGVVYTYPVDAQIDVPLGAPVLVTFSDPVEKAALGACTGTSADVSGAFCLVGPDGPVDALPEIVGDGTTVQFSVSLAPATTYAVYARSALAPTATNLPATGPLVRFTTRSEQARAAGPALVAINGGPPDTPEAFRPMFESTTIRLVFSEPLDPRSVALAAGAIELVDAAGAQVPATVLAHGIHVAIDPTDDLVAGATYQLKLGDQLVDLGGQRVAPSTIALTPRATGASRPVAQAMRTRQPGDAGPATSHVSATPNVITIDKPLVGRQTSQMQPAVLIAELGDPTALSGPVAFTIRRGQRLRASGLDIQLGGELPVGLSTGDIYIELLTDAGGRLYRNPHRPADQVPDNARAPLYVDLSMDIAVYGVDPTGNAVVTQTVLGVQASGTAVADAGALDIQSVVAMDLGLLGIARAPTNMVLELITDATAQRQVDQIAPTLVASLPASTGELAVDDGLELIFSEPIDLDRARAGGLGLETQSGTPVPSVIESHGAAVVIRPVTALAYSTGYRVAMANVTDMAGNALAGAPAMTFSTPPLVATDIPLSVAAVRPGVPCTLTGGTAQSPGRCSGGADGDDLYRPFTLPANESISVTFTQPPLPASIVRGTACNSGSVRIEEVTSAGACASAVPGTLITHDRSLSFVPDTPWQLGKRYRLSLISGTNTSCDAGELCGITPRRAPSLDPLAGATSGDSGGPNLVVDFTGAPATAGTPMTTASAPFTDVNGSGFLETGEQLADANRVALRITDTGGIVTAASFNAPDCVPSTPGTDACMYMSGTMPVELMPVAHDCKLPDGTTAARCVPVVMSPQVMYATSLRMDATAIGLLPIHSDTGLSVMRFREPVGGPITGYLIDDNGTPTLVLGLALYLDDHDLSLPVSSHDLHSKPLSTVLRGPMRFLPDGRIALALANVAALPITVTITAVGLLPGTVQMLIPAGEMKVQLVSPPLRGGLP